MWLQTLLALLVVYMLVAYKQQTRRRLAVANLKGPYCVPGLGALQLFFVLNTKTFLDNIIEGSKRFDKVVHVWALNRLIVVSTDLELNEQLLASSQHLAKQRNYRLLHQWLGTGLLMSDGHKWFTRRKAITPTFHFKILEQFIEVFDQQTTIFVQRLAQEADGQHAFDVYPYVCLAALDIIAETAMGTKVHAQTDASTHYVLAVNELTKLMSWRILKLHLNNELLFSLMYPHKKLRQIQLIKSMHNFTMNVIEERRRALTSANNANVLLNNNNATNSETEHIGGKKRMALLDVLLQSTIEGKPLTNEDIREEVDTFMFEGHDTTTSALGFALHLLARHPQAQQALLDEAVRVLGDSTEQPKPLTWAHLNELKYTDCVIKETLRLYPSVPLIGRNINEDFNYTHSKLGSGVIPAGTEFLIGIHCMMRDEDYFKDALAFQPERHIDKEDIGAFAFIPFSAGPRNCIGQKFALLEMKTLLAKTVRAYELLPLGEPVMPELNIVLRSTNGFQLGLRPRQLS